MRVMAFVLALITADPAVKVCLAEIEQSRAALEKRQALLAQAPDDAQRLTLLFQIDQDSLAAFPKTDALDDGQFREVAAASDRMVRDINQANLTVMERMIPSSGWFSSKVYGQQAATGAFLVLQHSDNPTLQRKYLPAIGAMVASGDALGSEYAMLVDRIAVYEGRPQRYGSQMHCVDGRMVPQPMEDAENIDAIRAPMGFRWATYKDYLANFGACPRYMRVKSQPL